MPNECRRSKAEAGPWEAVGIPWGDGPLEYGGGKRQVLGDTEVQGDGGGARESGTVRAGRASSKLRGRALQSNQPRTTERTGPCALGAREEAIPLRPHRS